MRTVSLLLALLPPIAFAQMDPASYTTADTVRWAGPVGNDNNDCLYPHTPCRTIGGALNKSPKNLRHLLTIKVAAGSYPGFIISGFRVDGATQAATAGLLIDGQLANITPTTSTATGTATAGSAGSNTTFGTLTDSGKTWTVNDPAIVGKYVSILGGTGAGQVAVVVSNTATVLTIAGSWVSPVAGSTYALQASTVNITTSVPQVVKPQGGLATVPAAGVQITGNNTGGSRITLRNINIVPSPADRGMVIQGPGNGVDLVQVSISTGALSGITTISTTPSTLSLIGCVVANSGTGTGLCGASGSGTINSSLFTGSTGTACLFTGVGGWSITGTTLKSATGVSAQTYAGVSLIGVRCDCASAATSTCVGVGGHPGSFTTGSIRPAAASGFFLDVRDCTAGVVVSGAGSSFVMSTTSVISGNALSYAIHAYHGGSATMATAVQTILVGPNDGGQTISADGGFQEIAVDNGLSTAGFGSLAASFGCLINATTTSRICRL